MAAIAIGAVRPDEPDQRARVAEVRVGHDDRDDQQREPGRRRRRRACAACDRATRPRRGRAGAPGARRSSSGTASGVVGHRASWRAASSADGRSKRGGPAVDLAAGVDRDGEHDHQAADDVLEERVDLHDAHHVVHHREDRDAAEGADDVALAAGQQRAAEDDGRDRHQVVVALGADGRAADAEPGEQQQPGAARRAREQSTCAASTGTDVRRRRTAGRPRGCRRRRTGGRPRRVRRSIRIAGAGAAEHDQRGERHRPDLGGADQPEARGAEPKLPW